MNSDQKIVVCYLDYGGVVHSQKVHQLRHRHPPVNLALFEWAPLLQELFLPHPNVRIILSTSWVAETSFEEARSRLPQRLRSRVIGSTYTSENSSIIDAWTRGKQIEKDAKSRRLTRWFAIDDDTSGWTTEGQERLVLTSADNGLSDKNTREIVRLTIETLSKT